jgi:hypothetical protein
MKEVIAVKDGTMPVIPARLCCLAREAALRCAVLSEAKELDRTETLHFVQGDCKQSSRIPGPFARQPRARVTNQGGIPFNHLCDELQTQDTSTINNS